MSESQDQNIPTAEQSAETQYNSERAAAWETAVEAMTAAVRLSHPKHGDLDFAGFLASALAAVAANVGSSYRLVAGRPGSWEADHVLSLVRGTVGHDDEYLLSHRTEPVVIPLNVHELMFQDAWDRTHNTNTPYDIEYAEVFARHEALPEDEFDPAAENAELEAVFARWAARYADYAGAFTTAVMTEAAQIEGLQVPVTVTAETEPEEGDLLHPDEFDDPDPLVWRLWDTARRTVPLPYDEPHPGPSTSSGAEVPEL